jgi:IclR family transcriptional regulator, acetate operon repressor
VSGYQELRDKTGETAGLNIIQNKSRICIAKAESLHDLRRFIEVGQPLPLHAGGLDPVWWVQQRLDFKLILLILSD